MPDAPPDAPNLTSLFREIAGTLPLFQARLDASYLSDLTGFGEWVRALEGTSWQNVARELVPARLIAQDTTIQVELRTLKAEGGQIGAAMVNTAFSRRYPKQTMGAQRIRISIHATSFPPGADLRTGEKKGHSNE